MLQVYDNCNCGCSPPPPNTDCNCFPLVNSSVCPCLSCMKCNAGNITSFDLQNTHISGTIPTQIGQLVSLTYLDFSSTQISGTIPTQIGQLSYLTWLDFQRTQISGTIPTQIGQLSSLTWLAFHSTQISGTIPTQIGQLSSLNFLDLSNTQINGTIPTQIGKISLLFYLDLSSIQISGTIPTQIGELIHLIYLNASNTRLSGGFPQLSGLTRLNTLNLGKTNICGCPLLPFQLMRYCNSDFVNIQCTCPSISNCQCCFCVQLPTCPQVFSPSSISNNSVTNQSIPVSNPNPNVANISSTNQSIPVSPPSPNDANISSTNQSIPVSHPSPNDANITLLPSYQPVSQYVPDVDCNGYIEYKELFICKSGNWTSNSDVTLNETYLLNGKFDFPSLFIYGNVIIQESSVNLQDNLFLQKQSVMIIENSDITVNGNFLTEYGSIIIIRNINSNYFNIIIKQYALLNGTSLIVNANSSQENQILSILTAKFINMTFNSIYINLTHDELLPCDSINLEQRIEVSSQCNLIVIFNVINRGSSELPQWVYIIIGIVGLLFLIAVIVSAFLIWKTFEKREKKFNNIAERVLTMEK